MQQVNPQKPLAHAEALDVYMDQLVGASDKAKEVGLAFQAEYRSRYRKLSPAERKLAIESMTQGSNLMASLSLAALEPGSSTTSLSGRNITAMVAHVQGADLDTLIDAASGIISVKEKLLDSVSSSGRSRLETKLDSLNTKLQVAMSNRTIDPDSLRKELIDALAVIRDLKNNDFREYYQGIAGVEIGVKNVTKGKVLEVVKEIARRGGNRTDKISQKLTKHVTPDSSPVLDSIAIGILNEDSLDLAGTGLENERWPTLVGKHLINTWDLKVERSILDNAKRNLAIDYVNSVASKGDILFAITQREKDVTKLLDELAQDDLGERKTVTENFADQMMKLKMLYMISALGTGIDTDEIKKNGGQIHVKDYNGFKPDDFEGVSSLLNAFARERTQAEYRPGARLARSTAMRVIEDTGLVEHSAEVLNSAAKPGRSGGLNKAYLQLAGGNYLNNLSAEVALNTREVVQQEGQDSQTAIYSAYQATSWFIKSLFETTGPGLREYVESGDQIEQNMFSAIGEVRGAGSSAQA